MQQRGEDAAVTERARAPKPASGAESDAASLRSLPYPVEQPIEPLRHKLLRHLTRRCVAQILATNFEAQDHRPRERGNGRQPPIRELFG